MLLSNPFKPDPRVYEEAKALIEDGHSVKIIAWDRELRFKKREKIDGVEVLRVQVRGGYGKVQDFLPGLMKFYIEASRIAKRLKYEAVHAHDFDTLPLGLLLARIKRAHMIYDVHDDYASMISESVPSIVALYVDVTQRVMMRFATRVIYANDALSELLGVPGTVVMNCKDSEDYDLDVQSLRDEMGIDGFTVVYIGIFRQIEFLRILIEAVKRSGIYLVLGGDGPYKDEVMRMIEGEERIKYVGWVSANDIPRYTKLADVIVVLNDPSKRYDRLSTPVKMFEAMAAGVPVIVSKGGEAEKIVLRERCGMAVEFGNVDSLLSALERVKDENLRAEMGKNALRAARKRYNKKMQMNNLKELYRTLG